MRRISPEDGSKLALIAYGGRGSAEEFGIRGAFARSVALALNGHRVGREAETCAAVIRRWRKGLSDAR